MYVPTEYFIASFIINIILIFLLIFILALGSPALTYMVAKLRKKDLLLLFQGNDRFKLVPADYGTIEVTKKGAWIPKKKKTWNWDGVQVCAVYDGWGITYDAEMQQAVKALEKKGIKSYEELEERIIQTERAKQELLNCNDEERRKAIKEWIENYGVDRRDPVVYRAFGVVTIKDVEQFFSNIYPSEVKAHIDENIVELARQYMNPITKIVPWIIILVIVLIAGGIAYQLFSPNVPLSGSI